MSAKNRFPIDIDNRESKKSVVQRFMTAESELTSEPPKVQESEIKQPEYYDAPRRKAEDEEISEDESVKVSTEKARKPIKGSKTDNESHEPTVQKEKINPFVTPKLKEKYAPKKDSQAEKPEIYLPYVGENFKPIKTPRSQTQNEVLNSKDIKNITIEEIEETLEEDSTNAVYDNELPVSNAASQNIEAKSEKSFEIEIVDETEEYDVEIEMISEDEGGEAESVNEISDEDDTFDVLSVLQDSQEKIDEMLKRSSNNSMGVDYKTSEFSEETERVLGRAVIKKILRRAYDHDDQSIAHYLEMLEKNDVKSRYYFKNTLEDSVVEEVEATLKRINDMCKCEKCFADICAITLNALKPHYVTTAMDELYDRVAFSDFEKLMEISEEVFKAIDIIKEHPAHK